MPIYSSWGTSETLAPAVNSRLYAPSLRRFLNADEIKARGSPIPQKKIERTEAKYLRLVQPAELQQVRLYAEQPVYVLNLEKFPVFLS